MLSLGEQQRVAFLHLEQFSHHYNCLLHLTQSVSCAELVDRVGGLEAEAEWSHVLSLGEQQRVAFLRLLLHAPAMAFLDEATGALDSATEAALYTALRQHCSSYVSVGECFTHPTTPVPLLANKGRIIHSAARHCIYLSFGECASWLMSCCTDLLLSIASVRPNIALSLALQLP